MIDIRRRDIVVTYCHEVMVTMMMMLRIEFLWLAIGCSHVLAKVDKKDKEGSNKADTVVGLSALDRRVSRY